MTFDKKFLIITAHPDDLEMACGGLVAKINASGGSVTNLILVQPSAETNKKRSMEVVKKKVKTYLDLNPWSTILLCMTTEGLI